MQGLEKILEEIEEGTYTFELLGREVDFVAIEWVRGIIRKHANEVWIPVEERLPETDGFYIATMDGEIAGQKYHLLDWQNLKMGNGWMMRKIITALLLGILYRIRIIRKTAGSISRTGRTDLCGGSSVGYENWIA